MHIVPLSIVICTCIVIYEVLGENLNMLQKEQIVSGYCAVSWENIRHLFCQNFLENLDIGATLCIYYQGQCVVDLAGGWFDIENRTRPYTHDTLQIVYSTGKGVMATALALCVQRGLLDYEEYVATYWPEFGKNGKQNVKVKDLLSHRAGWIVIDDNDGILKVEDTFDGKIKM
jgi:CubicO group peptidase (beta-lactamase class C family)